MKDQKLNTVHHTTLIPTVNLNNSFKRKRQLRKPVKCWEWRAFTNSAHAKPHFLLHHWALAEEPLDLDYPPALLDKKLELPDKYTHQEYADHLVNPNWTKTQTDILMQLALQFDLHWPVIYDRFPQPHTFQPEDMKERFF